LKWSTTKESQSYSKTVSNWELCSLRPPNFLAWCLLAFPSVGGAPKGPPAVPPITTRAVALRESIRLGGELYRAGHYTQASQVFESAFEEAESLSLPSLAGRALGNLGGCRFALHQYRAALQSFFASPPFFGIGGGHRGGGSLGRGHCISVLRHR